MDENELSDDKVTGLSEERVGCSGSASNVCFAIGGGNDNVRWSGDKTTGMLVGV